MTPPPARPARRRALAVLLVAGGGLLPTTAATAQTAESAQVAAGPPVRVSVADDERQASGASVGASVSADGRYVVFASDARDLVPGDTNGATDVFRRDRRTGSTERISVTGNGRQADGPSSVGQQAVSADGRHVLFSSRASNLQPGLTSRNTRWWVRDTVARTTRRVDGPPAGGVDNATATAAVLDPDGTHVVLRSDQRYGPAPTTGDHLWLREIGTGRTTQVDVSSAEVSSDGDGGRGFWVSAGGRFVAFTDTASNLAAEDVERGTSMVYLRDVAAGRTALVSRTGGGMLPSSAESPVVSADGRWVAFAAVPGGDTRQVYLRDRRTRTTSWVSRPAAGTPDGSAEPVGVSADGSRVAFRSDSASLVPGDRNGAPDVFLRDRADGSLLRVSSGTGSGDGALSLDGRSVAFATSAPLTAADTNAVADVYVRRLR